MSCVQFQPQEINLSHPSDPPLDLKQPYVTFKVILEKEMWSLSLIPILSNFQTPVYNMKHNIQQTLLYI